MRFKTIQDAYETVASGDKFTAPSLTEPNQTRSLKQIIQARSNGITLETNQREPFYSDQDIPDFDQMDLVELGDYRDYLSNRRHELEEELRSRHTAAQIAPPKSEAPTDEGGTRPAAEPSV